MHPSIHLSEDAHGISRTVDDIRTAITSGYSAELWKTILHECDSYPNEPPIVPESMFEGRSETQAAWANRDYTVVYAAGKRVRWSAFAALVTGERRFADESLRQMDSLFDPDQWPIWRDKSHLQNPADLRTGMLAKDLGIAFDWLYPLLTDAERKRIVDGIGERAIVPFKQSVEDGAFWLTSMHNWTTCVVGGLGVAGMALREEHPDGQWLIDLSAPIVREYVDHSLGAEGEFNESVGYASALILAIAYLDALRTATSGELDYIVESRIEQALIWYMNFIVPPGCVLPFGDANPGASPDVSMFALGARAFARGVFQWFYLEHVADSTRKDEVFDLIWFDPTVEPSSPDDELPLGRAYHEYGACIASRSSWDPHAAATVVCGKAGIEPHHQHHDAGQIVIGGYGKRLIVDLGSPSEYPKDFFGETRWAYYNASSSSHNVLSIGGREMPDDAACRFAESRFDDRFGFWSLDTTSCVAGATAAGRTVLHVLPSVVAVVDSYSLDASRDNDIMLRWHTGEEPDISEAGFSFESDGVGLVGAVSAANAFELSLGHHEYRTPHDMGRSGAPLERRHEPYVSIEIPAGEGPSDMHVSGWIFSLFAIVAPGSEERPDDVIDRIEGDDAASYQIRNGRQTCDISFADGRIAVTIDGTRFQFDCV